MIYIDRWINNQSSNAMRGSWVGGLGGLIHGSVAVEGGDSPGVSPGTDTEILRRDGSPWCFLSPLVARSLISSRLGIFTVGTFGVCTGVTEVGMYCWITGGEVGIMGVNPRVLLVGIVLPAFRVSEMTGNRTRGT